MSRLTDNLEEIAEHIREDFEAKDAAREKVLPLCREAIRHCANAIRAVHRRQFGRAKELLKSAREKMNEVEKSTADYGELDYAGFVRDAKKEFAEGSITLALVMGKQLPAPDELGVDAVAYLNGLGEATGELRRYILDSLRRGDLSQGEELLSAMDDIYNALVSMDFPDAITGGLRRTTDMVRGVLERTRSDLTLMTGQQRLVDKLTDFSQGK
jgi:translin